MPELSVVIPCCNEERSIPRFRTELYPALDALGLSYEVVAVDDGSTDGTRAALKALASEGAAHPLELVAHETNRGLGAALRTGFAAARGEWVTVLDADLTFHPRHIADLLRRQRETSADLVGGSPYLEGGGASAVPWSRRLPSLLLNSFYRGFLSPALTAYTPMFRLYRRSVLSQLKLESDGFQINAEIAALFIRRRLKVAEIAVPLTTRSEGASKLRRWRELRRHGRLILRLMAARRAGPSARRPA